MSLEEHSTGTGTNGVTAGRTRKPMDFGPPEKDFPMPARGETSSDEITFLAMVKQLEPGYSRKIDNVSPQTAKARLDKLPNASEYVGKYTDQPPYGRHFRVWRRAAQ